MIPSKSSSSIPCIIENLIDRAPNKPDYLEIFSNWAAIVGEDTASICLPYRAINIGKNKVLALKTLKGYGLEIQHESCKILDEINKFLGKKTFSQIKVIQTDKIKKF
jgi:hypothetical protein